MQLIFLIDFKNLGKPDNHIQHEKNEIRVE